MYLFIINSASGKGNALSLWNETEKKLQQKHFIFKAFISDSEVETRDFIKKEMKEHSIETIGVVGGDGTVASIIQEIAGTRISLAILPAGSGNDTARAFQLSHTPDHFVTGLTKNETVMIDLLNINGRFGTTIVGVGLDANIGQRVNRSFYKPILNKLGIGSFAYTIAAISALLTFKPFQSYVTIDETSYNMKRNWLTAIGNTTSYGGGLVVCPTARPADGILNVTMLHDVGRLTVLFRLFPILLQSKPVLHSGVTYREGKQISIHTKRPIPVIVDGEIIQTTPIKIQIAEQALRLVVTR